MNKICTIYEQNTLALPSPTAIFQNPTPIKVQYSQNHDGVGEWYV